MLTVNQIKKSYNHFNLNCSLELKPGTITGLIGKNGSGKTTLFKSILGLIKPGEGEIKLFNKTIEKLTLEDKQKIGVIFSDSGFNKNLTPQDIILILKNLYKNFNEDFLIWEFRRNNIPLNKKIKKLSLGTLAKLKILIALSFNPKLLILDEPTLGLDVIARNEVYDLLGNFMNDDEERSILISSHISNDLEILCDDLYLLDNGKIQFYEETDKILSDYGIIKVTPEQFASLTPNYILYFQKEIYGYKCLTNQKQYYIENYPDISIEPGTIDETMTLILNGQNFITREITSNERFIN